MLSWEEISVRFIETYGLKTYDWRRFFLKTLYDEGYLGHFEFEYQPLALRARLEMVLYVLLRDEYEVDGTTVPAERLCVRLIPQINGIYIGSTFQRRMGENDWLDTNGRTKYVESSDPEPIVEWLRRLPLDWKSLQKIAVDPID